MSRDQLDDNMGTKNFQLHYAPSGHPSHLTSPLRGDALLTHPLLNKGGSFTLSERNAMDLNGLLPAGQLTLDEQVENAYRAFQRLSDPMERFIYLDHLMDDNYVLACRLISSYLKDMASIVYTPTVGCAVRQFPHVFRNQRGAYLAYPNRSTLEADIRNLANHPIRYVVISDGSAVLGLGDQGLGGLMICRSKTMMYTVAGNVSPYLGMPVVIDVGTDNEALRGHPSYRGWRHPRIDEASYAIYMDDIVCLLKHYIPHLYVHWEDFAAPRSQHWLDRYQGQICQFNDDIQGTGSITLAAILAALDRTGQSLRDQRIVVFGAGCAGQGITQQVAQHMRHLGMTPDAIRDAFWLVDQPGLLMSDHQLSPFQATYAKPRSTCEGWATDASGRITLEEVVQRVHPTLLIGTSGQPGAFHEGVIQTMAAHCQQPIVFPLSNPTERVEVTPTDLMTWTNGQALIATGSPFPPVRWQQQDIPIAQCNNALIFPGIGLGAMAAHATSVTPGMLSAACEAVCNASRQLHQVDPLAPLLPPLSAGPTLTQAIAQAVAEAAIDQGVSHLPSKDALPKAFATLVWQGDYLPIQPAT